MRRKLAMALVGASALSACGIDSEQPPNTAGTSAALTRGFTPSDVSGIVAELRGADPRGYRLVLPEFRGTVAIGQKTYGTLPLARVREIAVLRNVTLQQNANVVTAADAHLPNGTGGGAGGGGGNGPGSMINTAAAGDDLTQRIDRVLANIDAAEYQFSALR